MVTQQQLSEYSSYILNKLLLSPQQTVQISSEWANQFTTEAGVYLLWEEDEIVYVGETGSIRGRMNNLLRTVNHQVRRNIANMHFAGEEGFKKGSSTQKHPPHIELMLDEFLTAKVKVSVLPISFGRKEIEEAICAIKKPIYNQREKRKK